MPLVGLDVGEWIESDGEVEAEAGGDVLRDEIAQQRRFARASLADEVEVMALVGSRNAEGDVVPPAVPVSDVGEMLVHGAVASRHS